MCSLEDRPGTVLSGKAWHKAISRLGHGERQGGRHESSSKMRDVMKRVGGFPARLAERGKDALRALEGGMGNRYMAETEPPQVGTGLSLPRIERRPCKLSRQRGIAGESFAMAAQGFLGKWTGCGCDPKVLAKTRTGVFNVSEPCH